MKHFKKLFISFFVAFMLVAICPKCAPFKVNAANVKINKKKIILVQKQKAKLKITGTKDSVKWSSKNTYVAKVSKKGIVTAKNEGTARIIAQVGKKKI